MKEVGSIGADPRQKHWAPHISRSLTAPWAASIRRYWDMNQICVTCGGELKFNRTSGLYECASCGKVHAVVGRESPLSLLDVDDKMHAHQYEEAKEMLKELCIMEPANPIFVLRSILASFKMTSTSLLLSCAKTNPSLCSSIMNSEEWDELKPYLSGSHSNFIKDIKRYCQVSIEIHSLSQKIERNKAFLSAPGRTSGSALIVPAKDGENKDGENEDAPDGFLSRLKSRMPKSRQDQIQAKEEAAKAELEADQKTLSELSQEQATLLLSIKELEETL